MVLTLGAGCSALHRPRGPLEQKTSETSTIGINLDAARVTDLDPIIDLANPTDHSIRLLSVSSVKDPRSPTRPKVVLFRMAGPDRTGSMSGGIITEKDIGAPLLPASKAVIPPGADEDDYIILVRYSVPPGTRWARDKGLRLTYSTNGHTYSSVWKHEISMCSRKAMGARFCNHLY